MSVEIVPWICRDEWEFCRDNLFGEDLLMKKKAVEHLHIWKTRCLKLPLAVECTLILMDTHLQGMQCNENENRMLNLMNLELTYSMAVTKFVNFVTDPGSGNRSTNTLQEFAQELGIPAWIVDLRHKAAHCSSVPNLSLLREAVEFCLKWLYDEYWSNADFEDVSNVDENSLKDVETCLEVYLTVKKHIFNNAVQVSQIDAEDRQKIYRYFCKTSEVEDYERFDSWDLNEISRIALIKLSKMIKKDSHKSEQLIDKLLDDDTLLSPSTLDNENQLNDSTIQTWTDIISVLCASNASYHLLKSLINITSQDIELTYRKKSAAVYLNEIFKNILQWKDNTTEDIVEEDKKYKKKNKRNFGNNKKMAVSLLDLRRPQLGDQEKSDLLELALQCPNNFLLIYLNSLLRIQEPAMPSNNIDRILKLVAIYTDHVRSDREFGETGNYSLKSILGEKYEPESMQIDSEENTPHSIVNVNQPENDEIPENQTNDSNSGWKKCSNNWKWSQTPFGVLPWQEEFKPWLKLYQV